MRIHYVYFLHDEKTNELLYVGRSVVPKERKRHHEKRLGIKMVFGCNMRFDDFEKAACMERRKIMELQPRFNQVVHSAKGTLGFKYSDAARAEMSAARKGRIPSEEARRNMSIAQTGRKMSPEAIEKTRQAHLGKVVPQHVRDAHSARLKGRKLTPAHAAAIGNAHRGMVQSDETRAKIANALKGQKFTPERLENIRKAQQLRRQREANQ